MAVLWLTVLTAFMLCYLQPVASLRSDGYYINYVCCTGWTVLYSGASSCGLLIEDFCESSPCQNDGVCYPDVGYYECECQAGYTGVHCETWMDPCVMVSCGNGGTCVAEQGVTYSCQCEGNFGGQHCEIAVLECDETADPCDTYIDLNDATRSSAYYPSTNDYLSDYVLARGWYRGISSAGGDMPTSYVEAGYCSAAFPIYLTGGIPQDVDVIIKVNACSSRFGAIDEECVNQYQIPVKNCGDYRVYCFGPTVHSLDRFCMGDLVACQEDGGSSAINFEPTCGGDSMQLNEDPDIYEDGVELVQDFSQHLPICRAYNKILCDINHEDDSIFLEVTWYVEGDFIPIATRQGSGPISYQDLPAVLTTEDLIAAGYMAGITVVCQMRARATENSLPGRARETAFFIGAVPRETLFTIVENGDSVDYILDLTIPYVYVALGNCDDQTEDQYENPSQYLDIIVHIPDTGRDDGTCHPVDALVRLEIDITESTQCLIQASSNQIVATITGNIDGTYSRERRLAVQLSTPVSNSPNPFWEDYALPRAQVIVQDAESAIAHKLCYAYNDPHFKNFNGMRFEVQLEGYFVMYQHTTLPIRVEVFFKNRGHYTSVCGAAVRSGGEVFIYDRCVYNRPAYISAYDCDSQDLDVDRISSSEYKVYLPTGTIVHIGANRGNGIYIIPSVTDWEHTEGLCGNLNDIASSPDDHRLRDSLTHDSGRYPNSFSNSWRVPRSESLYLGNIYDHIRYNDVEFCGCGLEDGEPVVKCSRQSQVRYCVDGRHPLVSEKSRRCNSVERRKRRSIVGTDDFDEERSFFIEDLDFEAQPEGWQGEWTEASATSYCEDYINNREVVNLCNAVAGVDVTTSVSDCVDDIYISGSTEFSEVHVSNIVSDCQTELNRNIYPTENETLIVDQNSILEALDSICINDCSGHGVCSNSTCNCDAEYTSSDCSVNNDHVPTLFDLPFGSLCDKNTRPCAEFAVYGDLFIEEENVTCRVTIKDYDGEILSEPQDVWADVIHYQKVMCPIETDLFVNITVDLPYRVELAISNNGQNYSDTEELIVYQSTCWNCSIVGGCFQQDNTCVEEGRCYVNEDVNDNNNCMACDGASANFTLQDGHCFIGGTCYSESFVHPDDASLYCDPYMDAYQWSVSVNSKTKKSKDDDNVNVIIISVIMVTGVLGVSLALGIFLVKKSLTNKEKTKPSDNYKSMEPPSNENSMLSSRPNTPRDLAISFVSNPSLTDNVEIFPMPSAIVQSETNNGLSILQQRDDAFGRVSFVKPLYSTTDGLQNDISTNTKITSVKSKAPRSHGLSSGQLLNLQRSKSSVASNSRIGSAKSGDSSKRPHSASSTNSMLQNSFNRHGMQTPSRLTQSLRSHQF